MQERWQDFVTVQKMISMYENFERYINSKIQVLHALFLLDCDRKSINISDIIINMQKKLLTKARKKAIIDEMCKHISKKENL